MSFNLFLLIGFYITLLCPCFVFASEESPSTNMNTTVVSFDSLITTAQLQSLNDQFRTKLSSQWSQMSQKFQQQARSKVSKELDRYNFSTVIGLRNNQLTILSNDVAEIPLDFSDLNVNVNMYYQITVQPSYRRDKQLRKDTYIIGFKASDILSIGFELRISFFREYDSKVEAVFSDLPYWIDDFPKNADDLSSSHFKNHQGIRAEILGNFGFEKLFNQSEAAKKAKFGLGYGYSSLFLMDFYKHTDDDVRVRFFGSNNKGSISANAEVGLGKSLFAWAPRWLKDLTQIGIFFRTQKSLNLFNKFPIDTNLSDFYFNFNPENRTEEQKSKTIHAFNEVLRNLRSGNFLKTFNPSNTEEEFTRILRSNAIKANEIAQEDLNLPSNQKRIQSIFEGKMLASIFSFDLGPKISHLFKASLGAGSSKIFISQLNTDKSFNHFILSNYFNRDYSSSFFGRSESEFISDVDALYTADSEQNVLDLTDIITRFQYRDKELNDIEYKIFSNRIVNSIPNGFQSKSQILDLIPKKDSTNLFASFKYAFNHQVLTAIAETPKSTLYYKIYNFIENHPEKSYMDLPRTENETPVYIDYYNFLHIVTNDIKELTDSGVTSQQKMDALDRLMSKKLFSRYLITQFLPSLISSDLQEKLLFVQFTTMSSQVEQKTLSLGPYKVSPVYDSITFIRSILNERNFEFSLESLNQESNLSNNPRTLFSGFKFN